MLEPSQMRCSIGIDVGGTKCAAALVDLPHGNVLARRLLPTRPERGGQAVLADVIELAHSMQEAAAPIGRSPKSIGVGVCELVSPTGEIHSEATVCWKGMPVAARLREDTQLAVFLDADVRAAARGEAHVGTGQTFSSFLYVTVGTGISMSFVLDKMPYAGARGLTGTFASSRGLIPGVDNTVVSGPPLEEFASGPALAARFAEVRHGFKGAAPDVLALAEAGDSEARAIVTSAGEALGAAIAHLVNVLDPQAVVMGGGLGLTDGLYRESLHRALRARVWSDLHRDVPLLSAQLGNDAGMIGAALAAGYLESGAPAC